MAIPITHRDDVCARLRTSLDHAKTSGRPVGVLVVRIENLRSLMLTRGYSVAEAANAHVDNILASVARAQDSHARIGDQDFVLILDGMSTAGAIQLAANKLLRVVGEQFEVDENKIPLVLRMGTTCSAVEQPTSPSMLLLEAETAVLQAERTQRQVVTYAEDSAVSPSDDWRIEELFDVAFERGEFELWYQPKYHIRTRALVGAEGLTRWTSHVLGSVSPARFIPIAERCGKIDRLTWSAINTALQQLASWNDPALSVAVNLSARSLDSDDIVARVKNALHLWSAKPEKLTVEVTESAVMQNPGCSLRILGELRALGLRISIDDFGTGQSSLAYVKSLPADELKIDRSFIVNIAQDAADRHIVQTIIELGHRLGHSVVAEGIEDLATLEVLDELGCDIAQGYYLNRPMSSVDFQALLSDLDSIRITSVTRGSLG